MIKFLFARNKVISVAIDKHSFWLENDGNLFTYDNGIKIIEIPEKYKAIENGQPSLLVYQKPYLYLTDSRGFIFSAIKNDASIHILDFSKLRNSGINASQKPNFDQLHTLTQVNGENRRYISLDFDSMTFTERFYPRESYDAFAGSKYYVARQKVGGDLWGVIALEPSTGEEVWRFDNFRKGLTSNIGAPLNEDVNKICGIYDDLLWVLLTGDRVVGLDPDSGQVIRQFTSDNADYSDFLKNNKKIPAHLPLGVADFLPDEGLMIGINDNGYCEVHLNALQPVWKAYSIGSTFKDHGFLGLMKIRAHEQFIYFAESMGSRIGAFDRRTRRVVWSDDLKIHNPEAGMVFEIKATDTGLYVQDTQQNLYVYAQEM